MISRILPYAISFVAAFALTFVLVPLVRETHRKLGMVDKPDPRRINKVPIPRGGGVAILLGVTISYLIYHFVSGQPAMKAISDAQFYRFAILSAGVSLLGLVDDRYSLPPKAKLLGQIVLAFLTWLWAGFGFVSLWPSLPMWADCILTVFWLVGAMNAFNLIDGLDGLATGIALIATLGMTGAVILVTDAGTPCFNFAIAGGLLAFLRYNYNPASVFLGDAGSMYLGYLVSSLPLITRAPNSFLVSVGVPLLAMGVPIFDTSLAIIRRSIRRVLNRADVSVGESKAVMTADADHLHHRILRSVGLDQRKAAWSLYCLAIGLVSVGLIGLCLKSRAAGLYLAALAVVVVVVFRDMARVELYDAGRLLTRIAHSQDVSSRRRIARLTVPFFIAFDLLVLTGLFFLCQRLFRIPFSAQTIRVALPIRVFSVFFFLVLFRTYVTAWGRAMPSNYFRLLLACVFGAILGAVASYYAPTHSPVLYSFTLTYAVTSIVALVLVRQFRGFVRDTFYAIDCSRLVGRKDVSRVLVYGAGLRYRAFRRELVRTTAANERIIVGIIDDDILLRNHFIGGIRIYGTLAQAPEIINRLNVDAVVIACDVTDEWLKIIRETLAPTGVKLTQFKLSETLI